MAPPTGWRISPQTSWRASMRLSPAVASAVAGPAVSALARTWRWETVHQDRWRQVADAGEPHVFLLWHEVLLPLLWHHRGRDIAIVVSEARDGQYLARYAEGLGYRLVVGSSSRGGVRALLGAVRELQAGGTVAFTPDGPRGPARVLKPGVIHAAQRGGGTIIPLHAAADRSWRLRSWDRFTIPKPFARVRVGYGIPFKVGPGAGEVAPALSRAEAELASLVREVAWQDAVMDTD